MNENELKSMIEEILQGMTGKEAGSSEEKSMLGKIDHPDLESIDDEDLEDITTIDLKKQLLVRNPANPDGYMKMKSYTPARIGVGREGTRYNLQTSLRFRADHAAAQDAVFSDVSEELVKEMGFVATQTVCQTKDEYLTNPGRGRQFDDEQKAIIKKAGAKHLKVQLMVGDGLSSAAIEANIEEILPSIKQGLAMYGLEYDQVIFVKYCRVGAMDVVGEVTDAEVVCLLVGERPGLVTAESMSAYIAYRPTVGMPEARRTVISNIHKGGTPAVEAGAYVAELIKKMIDTKKSGIDLKQV